MPVGARGGTWDEARVLVWTDREQTNVSYVAPRELAARNGLSDELAGRLAGIDALTDALVKS